MQKPSPRSKMFEELFGAFAQEAYEQMEQLDSELNTVIQEIPYDRIWSRPGLQTRDKAMITVAALVALGKEDQIRLHLKGFLNSGGTVEDVKSILIHLSMYCGFPAALNGFAALKDVAGQRSAECRAL